MTIHRTRDGYIFLISVLFIGIIATMTTFSLLLLGGAAEHSGKNIVDSAQAFEYAQLCVERSLRSLRSDLSHGGSGTVTFVYPDPAGSCTILPIGGSGTRNRRICAEGESNGSIRRIELDVTDLLPRVRIRSWKEVSTFTLCP